MYLPDEIKTKLHLQKVAGYSLACAGPPYMVAGYVPGAKVKTFRSLDKREYLMIIFLIYYQNHML